MLFLGGSSGEFSRTSPPGRDGRRRLAARTARAGGTDGGRKSMINWLSWVSWISWISWISLISWISQISWISLFFDIGDWNIILKSYIFI